MTDRPAATEYAPFYETYVSLVPEDAVLPVLIAQADLLRRVADSIPAERETFRYAPDKWSLRELFGHLTDAERVFGYRAFCISRGETQPLPGFDENAYVAHADFDRQSLESLSGDLTQLRGVNLSLFRRLDAAGWGGVGNAAGHPVTVRAIAYILAGHVRHHLRILRERYDVGAGA